jgi:hypothetical protein
MSLFPDLPLYFGQHLVNFDELLTLIYQVVDMRTPNRFFSLVLEPLIILAVAVKTLGAFPRPR